MMIQIPSIIRRTARLALLALLATAPAGCGPQRVSEEEAEAARKQMIAKGIKLPPRTPEEREAMFPTKIAPGRRPPPRR